jgi:UDP-4-amino-4,6-dideoxy-N-acetyl-beta-L-altrosamine N-acetyltransferase
MTTDTQTGLGQLRPIEMNELELMLLWRNSPSVRANMYTRHEISLSEHRAWWEKTGQRTDQRYRMYAFQGNPLGIVAFNGIDKVHRNSSWAFYASPDAPKGTGSRMEWLALEHAFGEMGLHKLHCEVLAFNQPVIKLHQKFGFTVEGIFRGHHLGEDGFVDIYRLGMLASEWGGRSKDLLSKLVQLSNRKSNDHESEHHHR